MEIGIVGAGIVAALGMILILLKTDLQKICGYALYVDVAFTGLLAYIFMGTYSGMLAAMVGGVILSAFLAIAKYLFGYKKLIRNGHRFVWQYYTH